MNLTGNIFPLDSKYLPAKNNFVGNRVPEVTDDRTQGYSQKSLWFDVSATPAEIYMCIDPSEGAAVWLKTTLTIDELGSMALLNGEAPTAEGDFLAGKEVGGVWTWVKKTTAEVAGILGLADKADKVATSPDPTGKTATFDAMGNLVASDYNVVDPSTIPDVTGKADKVATSPAPTGYVAEFDAGGNLAKSDKLSSAIGAEDTTKADKVATSPNPNGYFAELDATGNIVKSDKQPSDIPDVTGKADKVATSPAPTGYVAEFDVNGNLAKSDKLASAIGAEDTTKADKIITEVIKTETGSLSTAEVSGTIINNYGQSDDATLALPAAARGLSAMVICGTTVAKYLRLKANTDDKIYLDGAAGNDNEYVGIASAEQGAAITFATFQTGATDYDWIATTISGTWEAQV